MIEEIFDLRSIVNYSELKCYSKHSARNVQKINSSEMPAYLSQEIANILKLSDIEVTLRLVATLAVSAFGKKISSRPEEIFIKYNKGLMKNFTTDNMVEILTDPCPYMNLEGTADDYQDWAGIGGDADGDIEMIDEYSDDEEFCLDNEDNGETAIKEEVYSRDSTSQVIKSEFKFGTVQQMRITSEFLSGMGITAYEKLDKHRFQGRAARIRRSMVADQIKSNFRAEGELLTPGNRKKQGRGSDVRVAHFSGLDNSKLTLELSKRMV
jgi:hypothetical protein